MLLWNLLFILTAKFHKRQDSTHNIPLYIFLVNDFNFLEDKNNLSYSKIEYRLKKSAVLYSFSQPYIF